MKDVNHTGELGIDYALGRDKKISLKYRLKRRTDEVIRSIDKYAHKPIKSIIDLGTAEGRMLSVLQQTYKETICTGIEYNNDLVNLGKKMFPELDIRQGDIQELSLPDSSFDVAVATAVIEHVPDPLKALREVHRILSGKGILILTSPAPFLEKIATLIGHLPQEQHHEVMNIKKICRLLNEVGFKILLKQKFMFSPVGMPLELPIERIARSLGFDFLMANQLIVSQC